MSDIVNNIVGGIQYDIFRYIVGPLIVTIAATAVAQRAFGALKKRREAISFGIGSFILCVTLFYFVGSKPQQPYLVGGIQIWKRAEI